MSEEREKLQDADEEPEVEGHILRQEDDEKSADDESGVPDVEAHNLSQERKRDH